MGKRSKEVVSYTMSRIKSTGTSIEISLSKALWAAGLRGYRKHVKDVLGKPDFVWKKYKVVVFCDSSFWHGYDFEKLKKRLTTNRSYWLPKLERNVNRDRRYNEQLKADGWDVIRLWDFEIKKHMPECIKKIKEALEYAKTKKKI